MTEKEIADNLAIGGLRNTADSVSRLHVVRDFGAKLGTALMELINKNSAEHLSKNTIKDSWVSVTCDAIGSSDETCGPPASAIGAVKSMIDAQLLEAWRSAAGDPHHWVYKWLRDGAPVGITEHIKGPGIFPQCHRPADLQPQDIHCDEQ